MSRVPRDKSVILTCAVTGEGPIPNSFKDFPVTPEQISDAAIDAAKAGATAVHLHVRDPQTREGSRDPHMFKEVVDNIRNSCENIVINLSAGMGGDFLPKENNEGIASPESDIATIEERVAHLELCRPDLASLDVTTMNVSSANDRLNRSNAAVYLNTTRTLKGMAKRFNDFGVKPEIEIFGPGDIMFARSMIDEGLIDGTPFFQFVTDVKWGMPWSPETLIYMKNLLPENSQWAALGIGARQMPTVALSTIMGGHCRVGLEDNLYLKKGVFATNAQLVERAKSIIENLGYHVATPDEHREMLNLEKP